MSRQLLNKWLIMNKVNKPRVDLLKKNKSKMLKTNREHSDKELSVNTNKTLTVERIFSTHRLP